jgi:type VI secretion system secreted protein VgrG
MNTTDFTFAFEGADATRDPWAHLNVVCFHGREEISSLYRYDVTLLARPPIPEVDPHEIVGARATLRIATFTEPAYKLVHGVIAEAEELGPVPEGMLYRAVLMPPLVRAGHRTRCRIFLEKTTRAIIDAVLQGDPSLSRAEGAAVSEDDGSTASFTPAGERFTWRLLDSSRVDDATVRPYCVQYNESDLAFVSRILEEEGISYHFENGAGTCLLVLSDRDQGKARLEPFDPFGSDIQGRAVATMKLGAKLRAKKVRLHDYDWRKPALGMLAEAKEEQDDLFEYHYPGGFSYDAPSQGDLLAKARLDRYRVEAEYAVGDGQCRVLSAGSIFRLDHVKSRYDGEYLVTKLDVRGEQQGTAFMQSAQGTPAFSCTFQCARRGTGDSVEESRFRPPRVTPKPRIVGSQTAFVTADPQAKGAEIHVGGPAGNAIGCVRLKFHWDADQTRLSTEPSSCWVRVSQMFAGAGEGGMWHPRVGVEVIVEHLDGDPDRPLVTGRVYNGANRPPCPASGAPTISTFKSSSSPGGGKHNELSFDDAAGAEQIKLHAAKNWNSEVGNDRSEGVTNDSTSSVGKSRTESTGADRSTSVKGNNSERVDGDESVFVKRSQSQAISVDQSTTVGANQSLSVGANRTVSVGANQTSSVGANDSLSVAGNRSITVSGNRGEAVTGNATQSVSGNKTVGVSGNGEETVSGSRSITVAGPMSHTVSGAITLNGAANITQSAGADFAAGAAANAGVQAGVNLSLIAGAEAALQGASVHVTAGGEIILGAGGSAIKISGAGVEITGSTIKIAGGAVDVTGGMVKIN